MRAYNSGFIYTKTPQRQYASSIFEPPSLNWVRWPSAQNCGWNVFVVRISSKADLDVFLGEIANTPNPAGNRPVHEPVELMDIEEN